MARITQAQLERALGGAAVLVQLLDKDGDGTADATAITDILDETDEEANSYIGLAIDLSDSTIANSLILKRRQLDCAVYLCWLRGTSAQAMPPEVRVARDDAIAWFEAVRDRRAGLGLTTRPTSGQLVDQVTKSQASDTWFSDNSPRKWFDGWS